MEAPISASSLAAPRVSNCFSVTTRATLDHHASFTSTLRQTAPIIIGTSPGVEPGQIYGYRVQGASDPSKGMRFDPTKILLDPYGRGVVVPWHYNRDSGRQMGRKFVFTVKASELITHVKRFSRTKTLARDFGHIADLLGPRMGCFLFQLPPSVHYLRARLDRILTQLDPSRRNVVEFRHRSWWRESVFAAFRAAGVIFCSCSGPRLPDELVKSADDVYIRFHGTKRWYRHDYTREELAEWIA